MLGIQRKTKGERSRGNLKVYIRQSAPVSPCFPVLPVPPSASQYLPVLLVVPIALDLAHRALAVDRAYDPGRQAPGSEKAGSSPACLASRISTWEGEMLG